MIIEELAYKVTVRAEEFLSGKQKVEQGAKDLGDNVTESFGEVGKATKEAGKGVKAVGDQTKKTADDTKRPFGLISGGFLGSAKAAKEFGKQGKSAFSDMQLGAAKYLGLALSIEGTRRLFTSATSSLVDLGNASSFLDMDPKKLEGFQRGAKAVGASAEAMTNTLMRLNNAKNWNAAPMGDPDEFTKATLRLGTQTGVDIIGAKDPGEMFRRTEEALRKLPKQQAETYSQMLSIDPSMLPSMLDGSLDKNQEHYQKNSNASEEMIEKSKQVTAVMGDMDQTIKNLGNDLVLAFGGKVIDALNEFDAWVTNHKDDIIGFFRDGADWAKKMSDSVGGSSKALKMLMEIYAGYKIGGVYGAVGGALYEPLNNAAEKTIDKTDAGKWMRTHGVYLTTDWNVFFSEDSYKKHQAELDAQTKEPEQHAQSARRKRSNQFGMDALMNAVMMTESRGNPNAVSPAGEGRAYNPYGGEPEQHAQSTHRKRSNQFGMDALAKAVMMVESRGNPNAVSSAGAVGAYQFMPGTARDMGLRVDESVDERTDPVKSKAAFMKYMNLLLNRYGGNTELALMAYNGGMGRVDNALKGKGKPLAQETLDYPGKVADYYQQVSQLAGMQGMAGMQTQSVDNSQTTSNHYGTIQLNTNPQSIDEIAKSIDEQRRRSTMTGAFISGNG